jgi:hypothetical protein
MDTIHTLTQFGWGHEVTTGQRMIPPTEEDLVFAQDGEGNLITDQEGNYAKVPDKGWAPSFEEVNLDTVVIAEQTQQGITLIKLAVDKATLANILTFYVPFLDHDGRQALRDALSDTSGITVPQIDTSKLQLIEGGNRAQRRQR